MAKKQISRASLLRKLNRRDETIMGLEAVIGDQDKDIVRLQDKLFDAGSTITTASEEKSVLEKKVKIAVSSVSSQSSLANDLKAEVFGLEKTVETGIREIVKLGEEIKAGRERHEKTDKRRAELYREKIDTGAVVLELREQVADQNNHMSDLGSDIREYKRAIDEKNLYIKDLKEKVKLADENAQQKGREANTFQQFAHAAQEKQQELEKKIAVLERDIQRLAVDSSAMDEDFTATKRSLEIKTEALNRLEAEMLGELPRYKNSVHFAFLKIFNEFNLDPNELSSPAGSESDVDMIVAEFVQLKHQLGELFKVFSVDDQQDFFILETRARRANDVCKMLDIDISPEWPEVEAAIIKLQEKAKNHAEIVAKLAEMKEKGKDPRNFTRQDAIRATETKKPRRSIFSIFRRKEVSQEQIPVYKLIIESIENHPEQWAMGLYTFKHESSGLQLWIANGAGSMHTEECSARLNLGDRRGKQEIWDAYRKWQRRDVERALEKQEKTDEG